MKPVISTASESGTPATPAAGDASEVHDPRLASATEEYFSALEAGETPDRQKFLQRHADVADKLRPLLDNLDFLHIAAPQLRTPLSGSLLRQGTELNTTETLGDYRIVREVGRGGMGVVYEAEQISLSRRVALKMLPFAAVLDPRRLARFRNEAQAAANLTHQHIVPVYAVGCARGVHYYAMQFIDGCTLADMIAQLKKAAGKSSECTSSAAEQLADEFSSLVPGGELKSSKQRSAAPSATPRPSVALADTARPAQAVISTEHSHTTRHYVRRVTELAAKIAEALDYAHSQGIIHRDIKPANVLLDMQGQPWVTDFGLARVEADGGLTMTGDLVGTLRYMSPEQALARRVIVDHRTDIYSLGVTLYELLSLEPVFATSERQELLQDIALREPTALRKLQRSLPAELETIVMKAMAKNPHERYDTAQEMADDLRRHLADQPIHARRPSLLQRARRWSRRHRAIASTTGVVAACAIVIGAGLLWRERSQTLAALKQSERNFRDAQGAVDQCLTTISYSKLLDEPGMVGLRTELLQSAVKYYQRFAAEHADDPALRAELAAAHVRLAAIYNQTGSDAWINELEAVVDLVGPLVQHDADVTQWKSLREGMLFEKYIGGSVDRKFAKRVVSIATRGIATWEKLVQEHPNVPGFTYDLAGFHFIHAFTLFGDDHPSSRSAAITSFQQAIDCWEQFPGQSIGTVRPLMLGIALRHLAELYRRTGNAREAYERLSKAIQVLAKHDHTTGNAAAYDQEMILAYADLSALAPALNRRDEATALFREIANSDAHTAWEHRNRARAFEYLNEAYNQIAALTRAIELEPKNADIYSDRAKVYLQQGQFTEALADCNKGIELDADAGRYHLRARVLEKSGQPENALVDFTRAIEMEPNRDSCYVARADFHLRRGHYAEALSDYQQNLSLGSNRVDVQCRLGEIHTKTGNHKQAEADYQKAVEMAEASHSPQEQAFAYRCRAAFYFSQDRYAEALSDYQQNLSLGSKRVDIQCRLGEIHTKTGNRKQAEADYQKAVEMAEASHSPQEQAFAYGCRATFYFSQDRYEEALSDYQRTLATGGYRADVQHRLAEIHSKTGRLVAAEADYQKAAAMAAASGAARDRESTYQARVDFYLSQNRYAEAMADCSQAIELYSDVSWRSLRGDIMEKLGKSDQALADYNRAIELEPDYSNWYVDRAAFFLRQGRLAEALDDYNRFCDLESKQDVGFHQSSDGFSGSGRPRDGAFWYTVGVCQYRAGNFAAALASFQRSVAMPTRPRNVLELPRVTIENDRYAGFLMAMSQWQLGDKVKARAGYDAAVTWMNEHAPGDEQLKRYRNEAQTLLGLTAGQSTVSSTSE